MATRVLILTPTVFPAMTGNAVTVERWRRALTAKAMVVETLTSQGLRASEFMEHLKRFSPDLIHVYHAFRSGALLLDSFFSQQRFTMPIAASPGGTDINSDLEQSGRREAVIKVFNMAGVVIAQSPEAIRILQLLMPDRKHGILYVPKSFCWFGNRSYDLRKIAGCNREHVLFFLPAGIRPVKGNLECLPALEKVHKMRPQVRFIAAGPAIDSEYAARFEQEVQRLSKFARWIKGIEPSAMRSAYEGSDIVLNTSFSEGLSNSILEAIMSGRPVLATDIPGNRWPVLGEDGDSPAGCLYNPHDPEDFVQNAIKLIDDKDLRTALGRAPAARKPRWPGLEEEAGGLLAAYESILNSR